MANFANINSNNKVITIISIDDKNCENLNFPDSEQVGQSYINDILKKTGRWLQTSYNNNFRHTYASIDGYYVEELDAFIQKKPFDSWILNEETKKWEPPVIYPNDSKKYKWNENNKNWVEYDEGS